MAMEDYHYQAQLLHPFIPIYDPVGSTYHPYPTPDPSPPSIQLPTSSFSHDHDNQVVEEDKEEEQEEELGSMKEMIYRMAVMQPVVIDPAHIRKPKRRNVRVSDDPQTVVARHRRERISEKIRILQRLVPGGTKMDTATMLEEAIHYVKFLKRQIRHLQFTNHLLPPVPLLPSDWPTAGSLMDPTVENPNSNLIEPNDVLRDHYEGIYFQYDQGNS